MTPDFEGFSIPDFIHYIYFAILIIVHSNSNWNDVVVFKLELLDKIENKDA